MRGRRGGATYKPKNEGSFRGENTVFQPPITTKLKKKKKISLPLIARLTGGRLRCRNNIFCFINNIILVALEYIFLTPSILIFRSLYVYLLCVFVYVWACVFTYVSTHNELKQVFIAIICVQALATEINKPQNMFKTFIVIFIQLSVMHVCISTHIHIYVHMHTYTDMPKCFRV